MSLNENDTFISPRIKPVGFAASVRSAAWASNPDLEAAHDQSGSAGLFILTESGIYCKKGWCGVGDVNEIQVKMFVPYSAARFWKRPSEILYFRRPLFRRSLTGYAVGALFLSAEGCLPLNDGRFAAWKMASRLLCCIGISFLSVCMSYCLQDKTLE